MRRIIWSPDARANLAGIRAYVGEVAPRAAVRLAARLVLAADSLATNPDRGRPRRHGVRELVAIWPYVIRYVVEDEQVVIIGIRHGVRRPDTSPP